MKRRFLGMLILGSFLLSVLVFANEEKMNDPKTWTIDDVLNQESATSFDISPCGKGVVWVKSSPDKKENQRVTDLYLSSLVDSTQVQLARGKHSERNPKWSPDGNIIAFLSTREKEKGQQIMLMNSTGGEAWSITDLKNGVQSFEWRDEKHIIFSAREDPTYYENELKEKKDDAIVVGDQEHFWPVRLFQINIKSKEVKRFSFNSGKLSEFAISPDGRWVVTNESQDVHCSYDHRMPPKKFLYDLQGKSVEEIFTEKNMKLTGFQWTVDGAGFYYAQPLASNPDDDYVSVRTLYYFNLKTKKYDHVSLNWKWHLGFFGYFVTKGGILVSLANGTKNKQNQKNENNLDYWAGYSPTPDEVEELQPTIAELELSGLLLMEVGSRKPMSDELLIFDIDGNVAEWYVSEDSQRKIMGGSAIVPTDPKQKYQPPRIDYVGFRVVLRK